MASFLSSCLGCLFPSRFHYETADHEPLEADATIWFAGASPLVLDDCTNTALSSTYAIPVQPIDFAQESALLGGLLEETGQCADLVTTFGVTADTLSSGIVQSPTVLHLSAHGDFTRDGDFVLALETRKGAADLVSLPRLSRLLAGIHPRRMPRLVVLTLCHSEHLAPLFIRAGVPHVVATVAQERVTEESSLMFTKHFYLGLVHFFSFFFSL
jgi:hypothetical protein